MRSFSQYANCIPSRTSVVLVLLVAVIHSVNGFQTPVSKRIASLRKEPNPTFNAVVDDENMMEMNDIRRSLLQNIPLLLAGIVSQPGMARADESPPSPSPTPSSPPDDRPYAGKVIRLAAGVQYSDITEGSGPMVSQKESEGVLLIHLRGSTSNGSTLFDTKTGGAKNGGYGSPILHKLGTVQDFNYFGGNSSKRSRITLGVEDAILSNGIASWAGGYGKAEPMREGGIRRVVVPPALAYGNAGVSRYDAMKMGLDQPVPRDETLMYEIEVLRCLEVEVKIDNGSGEGVTQKVKACCPDELFPCKPPQGAQQ
mmetsp:Transcript_42863/g.43429  ORF Transcript_42863/g.43429 Transcript_42863/m.43429 type:complete len:312 (-) Transcript_42863:215-1150(-)